MHYFALHPKHQFSPMAVFAEDPTKVINDILDTSESCKGASRSFVLEPQKVLTLDPGGPISMSEKPVNFEVDGFKFRVQLSRISDILWLTGVDKERIPGFTRFRNFGQNVVMPTTLLKRLRDKLSELAKTDAAIHAEITAYEQYERLNQHPNVDLHLGIPRERKDN